MKENLKLGLILLVITAIAGLVLGGAYEVTKEPIAIRQQQDKQDAMKAILPAAEKFEDAKAKLNDKVLEVNAGMKGSDVIGYAIKVAPKGYSGAVQIMVGISTEGKVEGIKILSHSETPGLGANAPKPEFSNQYNKKSIDTKLEVVKGKASKPNEISAMTGATITSRAVTLGVNDAVEFYKTNLKGVQK